MKKTLMGLFIFIACMLMGAGCQKNENMSSSPAPEQKNDMSGTAEQLDTADKKENSMVASVNGVDITSNEVQEEMATLMQQFQGQIPPEQMEQQIPKINKQAMESLINKTLLFQEADKKNIQPAQKEIDAELNNIVSRFPAPDMFEKQLSTMGITREKLLQDITQNLKISTLVKDSTGEVPAVTDEEISSFYNGNPQNFQAPEQVKASHILFKVNPDDAQELKDQKRLELAALRGQIEKGADFAKLAKENSECPSKERGGDLGFFGRGSMVKPFEDTAFSMKNGDVSQVVETQFGYHLIKVVDRKESRTVPLEEVKEKISTHLTSEKERELFGVYLTELRKTAKIEYAENE